MEIDILRIFLAIVLLFFLPGYMVIKSLFPGKRDLDNEYNEIYVFTLSIAMSIVISILTGFILASLPPDASGKGYLRSPFIEISLITITIILFIIAWHRGAFPWLGKVHPKLQKVIKEEEYTAEEILELAREREILTRRVKEYTRKMRTVSKSMRNHYERKKKEAVKKLREVEKRIEDIEEKRAKKMGEE